MRNKIIAFICCFSLLLATIISVIDFWCFNEEFYASEYRQLNTAESIGMSQDDLDRATKVLLDYLKIKDADLFVEAMVKGEKREVFNEREKTHMVDVKALYENCMLVRNISFGFYAFSLVLLIFTKGLEALYRSYLRALAVFGSLFIFIGIFCLIDFDSFWTGFHHIFFAGNDLWLLDPRKDILIMMVPGKFFFDLCTAIVFTVLVIMVLYFIVLKILDKKVFNK